MYDAFTSVGVRVGRVTLMDNVGHKTQDIRNACTSKHEKRREIER